jgi:hypothetical protein
LAELTTNGGEHQQGAATSLLDWPVKPGGAFSVSVAVFYRMVAVRSKKGVFSAADPENTNVAAAK